VSACVTAGLTVLVLCYSLGCCSLGCHSLGCVRV
jgi:hypothetical protein